MINCYLNKAELGKKDIDTKIDHVSNICSEMEMNRYK